MSQQRVDGTILTMAAASAGPLLLVRRDDIDDHSWSGQAADDSLVIKKFSVGCLLNRLSEALRARNVGIVARVDHAAAAEKVGHWKGITIIIRSRIPRPW